ncbi:hypothetical protein BCR36DRAFT_448931 [Piromyces finnis]|uniref:Uncharacterized protein n=1 Tax=Piromyces finnis TaxID=1754191 RepID=A0A1Y1U6H6_9FUNG|nr:hypothetical protein BCR36DRAFT_448931 [Piromyces finnis]|eukprot:ORX33618.1 hypothetical protein BCR36DRAFT_448931 [Piromyces finnis]
MKWEEILDIIDPTRICKDSSSHFNQLAKCVFQVHTSKLLKELYSIGIMITY